MGENFGFIHDKLDIKILVLFILSRMTEPITYEAMTELAMCDGGVSFFVYADCVVELIKTGHVEFSDEKYSLTVKGAYISRITENSLPISVRAKADKLAAAKRTAINRNSMLKTSHEPAPDGGYMTDMIMSDGVSDIISLRMYTLNERQALKLEQGFRKNAETIYNALIKAILNE